jgi:hypothetical protein
MARQPRSPDASYQGSQPDAEPDNFTPATEELTLNHDVSDFLCAREPEAVSYLKTEIWDFLRSRCGTAYVLPSFGRPGKIDGYYHLSGSSLTRGQLQNRDQRSVSTGLTLPVYTIAWLARDDRAEKGTGAALIIEAAKRARSLFPTYGLTLYARNQSLITFYAKYGFKVVRNLKQEMDSGAGLTSMPPYLMYAPYEALIES